MYKDLDGKLITDGKKIPLLKMGAYLYIKPLVVENYEFELNSA